MMCSCGNVPSQTNSLKFQMYCVIIVIITLLLPFKRIITMPILRQYWSFFFPTPPRNALAIPHFCHFWENRHIVTRLSPLKMLAYGSFFQHGNNSGKRDTVAFHGACIECNMNVYAMGMSIATLKCLAFQAYMSLYV